MLIGRAEECSRVDALLAGARRGAGGALLVRGPAGIGKSTLLAHARRRADGMQVLTTTGVQSESRTPFAGLAAFLRPLLPRMAALPSDRRLTLERALALEPATSDRFAVGVATLELLALAAGERPICATVDDAHWLDPASSDALRFTARRLGSDPVALVMAACDDSQADFEAGGVTELPLAGLDAAATETLVEQVLGGPCPPTTARRLVAATGGNPLALVELTALCERERLTDLETEELPVPVGPQISRALSRRIAALGPPARRALGYAAVTESTDINEIALVLRRLGTDPSALAEAEQAGVMAIADGHARFSHPLLRAIAYQEVPSPERRVAHLAVAETIGEAGSRMRRAWHLACAVVEADEMVAARLEAAADEARAGAAPAAAGAALRRAARLSPQPQDRVRRLMAGAGDFHLAGRVEEGVAMLDEAAQNTTDPLLRSDIEHMRARLVFFCSPCERTRDALVAQAEAVADADPRRSAALLLDASMASVMAGQPRRALELASRARPSAAGDTGPLGLWADQCLGVGLLLCGQAPAAEALLARAAPLTEPADLVAAGFPAVGAALVYSWREQHEQARQRLQRLVDRARQESVLTLLPYALAGLADAAFALGDWNRAYAAATESVELAEEVGQSSELAHSLVRLAHVEAGQGREADCRRHLERASELAGDLGIGSVSTLAGTARGLLELGLGHPHAAIAVLRDTGRVSLASGLCEPGVSMWAGDLAEAYARADQPEEAHAVLAVLEDHATANRRSAALAVVARLQGLLAGPGDYGDRFTEALEWHERRPLPFDVARTRLCWGERLRRDRRRGAAREQLRAALEAFQGLGAAPWAQRARTELRAAGEVGVDRDRSEAADLTAQELQVALLVAEGATNREAAATLFLSPKTVEVHLTRAYRKLGVRSRTELARVLGDARQSNRGGE